MRWWRALGVLGLLAGLFAMHGPAPGSGVTGGHAHEQDRHGVVAQVMDHVCGHDGGQAGGHVRHADASCASGAVSDGPTLPLLAPDPLAARTADAALRPSPGRAVDACRAPPSLSELQLLRI
ncbi:DUF6153 family protein [Streptomyces thermocoprophilus]